jgi:hypothetical protein
VATQRNSRSSGRKSSSSPNSSSRSRSSSKSYEDGGAPQTSEKGQYERNLPAKGTMAEREYRDYSIMHPEEISGEPDVLLDVPVLKVDQIRLEVQDLDAAVHVQAEVLDLVKLSVGAQVHLGKVELNIEGVEAQALLKVRLAHITAIIDRVLTTLDRNPELVESIGKAVESAGHAVAELGEGGGQAVEDVGEGAGQALPAVGQGAGEAVSEVGQGAGQALPEVGQGAGQALGEVGQGAGQALP